MSYYYSRRPSTHWTIQHWAESVNAFHYNDCKLKTYLYHSKTFVRTGSTYVVNYRMAMNYSKKVTTFELMYQISSNNVYIQNWTPIPVEVMERMFRRDNGTWEFCSAYNDEERWRDNTEVVIQDGHFLFKYDTDWLRYRLGAIAQDTLTYSVPGKIIHEFDQSLAVALVYLDKKYTMTDIIAINDALSQIRHVEWAIDFGNDSANKTRKDRMRDNLQKAKKDLEQYEQGYQRILEGAAEAMNLLSTKYHVYIQV